MFSVSSRTRRTRSNTKNAKDSPARRLSDRCASCLYSSIGIVAVTAHVAERIHDADVALWREFIDALAAIPDDPYGASATSFGSATALMVQAIPSPYFNRVVALAPSDKDLVRDIIGFFAARLTPFRFDISPFACDVELLSRLYSEGCRPTDFRSTMYGSPFIRRDEMPEGVVVREVRPDEIGSFADLYERAYNFGRAVPKALQDFRRQALIARYRQPRWRFYVAIVDGMAAGGAIMHVRDDVAALAGGATLPALRGRGCQRALLMHRLMEAADLGCDLAVSTCSVGGTSQSNMERCGLSTAYTKVLWELGLDAQAQQRRLPMAPWVSLPPQVQEAS